MTKTHLFSLAVMIVSAIGGFVLGRITAPNPPILTDNTITLAKWYCEETITVLPPSKEKGSMVDALNNLNEGNISLSDEFIEGKLNYRMVQLFANAQELNKTIKLLPQPSPTAAVFLR